MYLIKTSGDTLESVIHNQRHASVTNPKDLSVGEIILVSKNKEDCEKDEKQIQYIMKCKGTRRLNPGEAEKNWPGKEGRWDYLISCENTQKLEKLTNVNYFFRSTTTIIPVS